MTNALPVELITHVRNVGIEPTTYRFDSFAVCIPKLDCVLQDSNLHLEVFRPLVMMP